MSHPEQQLKPDGAVSVSTTVFDDWVSCSDKLPDILDGETMSEEVLAGCWIIDNWLRDDHPQKRRFVFGACSVRMTDNLREFPQGKQWQTFGPSHNQITHWCHVNPPKE